MFEAIGEMVFVAAILVVGVLIVSFVDGMIREVYARWKQPEPSSEPESCGNCRFFNAGALECRRDTPYADLTDKRSEGEPDVVRSYWPGTRAELWCGLFERYEQPKGKA